MLCIVSLPWERSTIYLSIALFSKSRTCRIGINSSSPFWIFVITLYVKIKDIVLECVFVGRGIWWKYILSYREHVQMNILVQLDIWIWMWSMKGIYCIYDCQYTTHGIKGAYREHVHMNILVQLDTWIWMWSMKGIYCIYDFHYITCGIRGTSISFGNLQISLMV